jgi:hypothetical protein
MIFGVLNPLVKSMDPALDLDPSVIKKNNTKNFDSNFFVTFYHFLSLKNDLSVPSERKK